MLDNYEINSSTLAVVPLTNGKSKIYEFDNTFEVNMNVYDIINSSCKYFGSSYIGRYEGAKTLLGMSYKLPIIIEETKEIIFFPTSSPKLNECSWISLKDIENYDKKYNNVVVEFKNGLHLEFELSIFSFENQVFRALRLENIIKKRKMA